MGRLWFSKLGLPLTLYYISHACNSLPASATRWCSFLLLVERSVLFTAKFAVYSATSFGVLTPQGPSRSWNPSL